MKMPELRLASGEVCVGTSKELYCTFDAKAMCSHQVHGKLLPHLSLPSWGPLRLLQYSVSPPHSDLTVKLWYYLHFTAGACELSSLAKVTAVTESAPVLTEV